MTKQCRHCRGAGEVPFYRAATNPIDVLRVDKTHVTLTATSRIAGDDLDRDALVGPLARGTVVEAD